MLNNFVLCSKYKGKITHYLLKCFFNGRMFHFLLSLGKISSDKGINASCFNGFLFQILVKLCSFVSPAEELAQKDDLQLLFSAITSWCPPYNLPWRKSAGEVLMTISRHGLSVNVVKYIHGMCLSSVLFTEIFSCSSFIVSLFGK